MPFPNATNQMTTSIECEAAMSDAVLQAARAAMPADPACWFADPTCITRLPEKQRPLVPLLMALLDSTQAVAKAIGDNAFDDSRPLDKALAEELAKQSRDIAHDILGAKDAPDASDWSLPSMTGKELV